MNTGNGKMKKGTKQRIGNEVITVIRSRSSFSVLVTSHNNQTITLAKQSNHDVNRINYFRLKTSDFGAGRSANSNRLEK